MPSGRRPANAVVRLDIRIGRDECVVVLGDQQRLQQVIWNLLWNAIKFTPSGGVVGLTLGVTGDRVELKVSDTGVGISARVSAARHLRVVSPGGSGRACR